MQRLKFIFLIIGLANLVTSGALMLVFVFSSWHGGDTGRVLITFNEYGERLPETIFGIIALPSGLWSVYYLLNSYITQLKREQNDSRSDVVSKEATKKV